MTSAARSPGRVVAELAIRSIQAAGYCDEAIASVLRSDSARFGKLRTGQARLRDDELELIEYATGRTAFDWALAGTFEQADAPIDRADAQEPTVGQPVFARPFESSPPTR